MYKVLRFCTVAKFINLKSLNAEVQVFIVFSALDFTIRKSNQMQKQSEMLCFYIDKLQINKVKIAI